MDTTEASSHSVDLAEVPEASQLRTNPLTGAVALGAAAVSLAACGGGGGSGGSSGGSGGGGVTPVVLPTETEAARFLSQASFGADTASIAAIRTSGYEAWLTQQFATPPMDSHFGYVTRGGPLNCSPCDRQYINAFMESFWQQVAEGSDLLRQRVVFALTEIFVVSDVNSPLEGNAHAFASYLDMLGQHCFGNFRDLLEGVALSPAMAHYLSHFRNEKEDPATGRIPDENFAREVMQLFTIGLWQLNEDGSRRKDLSSNDIPTYAQSDISGMAKVFTGWSWGGPDDRYDRWQGWPIDGVDTVRWEIPMRHYQDFASVSEKRILNGAVIPAGTGAVESLRIALDTLFNHPNVGPFIGAQLIKRLVTSNPSAAYIRRVARAFANNGSGVRGDMKAVWRAILLDAEARGSDALTSRTAGKAREPILRLAAWLRAFRARADNRLYAIWNLEDTIWSIGQNPLRAPSVFNWFRPEYSPPGVVQQAGLVAPEFQIVHETTATGWANFAFDIAYYGLGWDESRLYSTYSELTPLASDVPGLIDRVDLLLTSRQMTDATRRLIRETVESFSLAETDGAYNRVSICVAMVLIAPEFLVQR